ncbi:MAG: response regulator [Nitrospirae bacterium]|nr:response regulator [Nitrospirota bacterium]
MDKRLEEREEIRLAVNINGIHNGQALDISPEGMFIKIPVEYKVGALVTLRFNINGVTIQTKALIRSFRPGVGAGVQFQGLSEAGEDRIIDFIEQNKKKHEAGSSRTGRAAVLLVDDSSATVEPFAAQLFLADIDVIRARNGVEAIKKLEESGSGIDLVITDLLMPVMDGFRLIHYIKGSPKFSRLPVVVLSSFNKGTDDIQRLSALGVDAGHIFMRQNSRVAEFAAAIARIIKESKNR